MSAVSKFDTLASAKELEKAGVPVDQAEAITRVISGALGVNLSDLTTKVDLAALKQELKAVLGALRQELKGDMEILRRDMTIRLGSLIVVAVGVLLAGIKYIH